MQEHQGWIANGEVVLEKEAEEDEKRVLAVEAEIRLGVLSQEENRSLADLDGNGLLSAC